jgi:hypothetical protein
MTLSKDWTKALIYDRRKKIGGSQGEAS